MDVLQKHAAFSFPVRFDVKEAEFPQPASSARKLNELKEQVSRNFKNTFGDVFRQFCPEQCILADVTVSSEAVSPEEALHATNAYIVTDGDTALRVKSLAAQILLDLTLTAKREPTF